MAVAVLPLLLPLLLLAVVASDERVEEREGVADRGDEGSAVSARETRRPPSRRGTS